ncbi:MAG: four-carbon acid sugar kinase family protein [Chromatiales bacterium]|jgi:3-dehydrotetronate 4-kinase|nr:four-carbon acid sugar kinase family protein [Chromatiales bacterium]
MLLGCIADDFTGATDLANTLVKEGMRVIQMIGVPKPDDIPTDVDAVVVALKSRSNPAADAVRESLAALAVLRDAGAAQFLFKYCSTFDSTEAGNIGPVADALAKVLDAKCSVVCPAFPETGRSIFNGYLFVGDKLLNESGMENHPLNPMGDANLVRVLARQSANSVGLVDFTTVERGPAAILAALEALGASGFQFAVVDAIRDEHLRDIGAALAGATLVTGGSGIALGLPDNFRRAGRLEARSDSGHLPTIDGTGAVLCGSCSVATRSQIAVWKASRPAFQMDVRALAKSAVDETNRALAWVDGLSDGDVPFIYTSDDPAAVAQVQAELGREVAGKLAEAAMATIAHELVTRGIRRLVVAGGETSGAVVTALKVRALRIGRQIDPGVPCTVTVSEPSLGLALKSGNFGGDGFFERALSMLGTNGVGH